MFDDEIREECSVVNPRPGDVLVFKAGNDWVGKAIAWLTDSDVSHAAMMLDGGKMVEMSASGIYAGNVEAMEGDSAILLRLEPEKEAGPLLAAAQKYIDSETRYDFPALAFLAGLIIYRRIRPTPKLAAITDLILRAACVAMDKLIQSVILKNPGKAMVCSQLVYQIYDDCGKEYRIQIQGGLLQGTDNEADGICLADLAQDAGELDMALLGEGSLPDAEELAQELCGALSETENGLDFAVADLGTLPAWTKGFIEKMEEFLEKSGSNLPINALFIAPSDLAYKSENLHTAGTLDIARLI